MVAIGPATNGEHRTANGLPVFNQRTLPPIGIAGLVLEPFHGPLRCVLQALAPQSMPAFTGYLWERGKRISQLELASTYHDILCKLVRLHIFCPLRLTTVVCFMFIFYPTAEKQACSGDQYRT